MSLVGHMHLYQLSLVVKGLGAEMLAPAGYLASASNTFGLVQQASKI